MCMIICLQLSLVTSNVYINNQNKHDKVLSSYKLKKSNNNKLNNDAMFNLLFNLIRRLIANLLNLLGINRSIELKPKVDKMIFINIIYSIRNLKLDGNLKICLNKDSNIDDAKQIIVNEINKILIKKFNNQDKLLSKNQIAIILAGQQLDDNSVIANYDLGQNTILNVVKIFDKSNLNDQKDQYYNESAFLLTTNQLNNESIDNKKLDEEELKNNDFVYLNKDGSEEIQPQLINKKSTNFFVYCSSRSCKKITNGKLRVRCSNCKDNTLIVEQGPKSWVDVLQKEKIKGKCQNFNCKKSIDQENYAEFYFKCSSDDHKINEDKENDDQLNNQQLKDDQALPLEFIKHNTRLSKCPICDEIKDKIFLFKCTHLICLDCFKFYLESKLNSRELILINNIGYTLNCPLFDCTDSYIEDTHYFHILSEHDYSRFLDFAMEEFVLNQGGVICPQANCAQPMLIDQQDNCKKMCCVNCGFLFCKSCKLEYHEGDCSTDIYLQSIKANEINNQTKSFSQLIKDKMFNWTKTDQLIKEIEIKNCPKCGVPTEKESGCVHIICKMCKFEWCFICNTEFSYDCMSNHWFE